MTLSYPRQEPTVSSRRVREDLRYMASLFETVCVSVSHVLSLDNYLAVDDLI